MADAGLLLARLILHHLGVRRVGEPVAIVILVVADLGAWRARLAGRLDAVHAGRRRVALRANHYKELAAIETSGQIADVVDPELLHILAVLEYPNDPAVFVLHPLVRQLLVNWQRKRAAKPPPG